MIPNDLRNLIKKYDPSTGSFVKIDGDGYWFDGENFVGWPIALKGDFRWYYKFYKGHLIGRSDDGELKLLQFQKPVATITISDSNHFLYCWSLNYIKFENHLYKINKHPSYKPTKMNLKGEIVETLPIKNVPRGGYYSILRDGMIYRFGSDAHETYDIKAKRWTQLQTKTLTNVFILGNTKRIFATTWKSVFEFIGDKWINTHISLPKRTKKRAPKKRGPGEKHN